MRRSVLGLVLAGAWSIGPGAVVRADEGGSMHESPHTEESEVLFGGKGMAMLEHLDGQEEDEDRAALGGGLYVETSLVPGWIELEVGAVALRARDEVELTLEPLLKKNFHLDERVDLYLGVGPTIGATLHDDGRDPTLIAGGFAVLGGYLWLDALVGMDLDVTVELASVPEPAVSVIVGLGPVLRL